MTTGEVTTYYYLGEKMIAQRKGTTLSYIHEDHLTGTSVTSNSSGTQTSSIKYYPYGDRRNSTGTIPTDKQFTGQRLDSTGLYYYGARYYDPTVGRFISPDPITHSEPLPIGQIIKGLTVCSTNVQYFSGQTRNPSIVNPQEHNRYSYALNNPLRYTDPDGHQFVEEALKDILYAIIFVIAGWIAYDVSYYSQETPAAYSDLGEDIKDAAVSTWNAITGFLMTTTHSKMMMIIRKKTIIRFWRKRILSMKQEPNIFSGMRKGTLAKIPLLIGQPWKKLQIIQMLTMDIQKQRVIIITLW